MSDEKVLLILLITKYFTPMKINNKVMTKMRDIPSAKIKVI